MLLHVVNLGHVSLPIVLARERPATAGRVVAAGYGTVKLFLLFMTVVNMSLQMRLCAEAFATARIVAFVVFAMVTLVMPEVLLAMHQHQSWEKNVLQLVWLVKSLVTAWLVTVI